MKFKDISNYKNLLIVDGLNLAFRWKNQQSTDFKEDYISTVKSLSHSFKSKRIIICVDKGHSSFRREIYPEYKLNRKERFQEQSVEEQEYFKEFFEEFNEAIDLAKQDPSLLVIQFNNVEADDTAAYLCQNKVILESFENIWLASSDKDWDLLVNDNIFRFSYVTREEISKENIFDKYGVFKEYLLTMKCLQGDAKDNITGVEKVGVKTAIKLIEEFGDIITILDNLPIPGKYKYIENLNNSSSLLLRNIELLDIVSFCKDAIGSENLNILDSLLLEYLDYDATTD